MKSLEDDPMSPKPPMRKASELGVRRAGRSHIGLIMMGLVALAFGAVSSAWAWPATQPAQRVVTVPAADPTARDGSSAAPQFGGPGAPSRQYQGVAHAQIDTPFAYILRDSIWRFTLGQPKLIHVCWESPGSDTEKGWVRDAVTTTWEAYSGLHFVGWVACTEGLQAIRIAITENGPHVTQLGRYLRAVPQGMELNFTFSTWSPGCQAASYREFCIRSIAVHEFGHAIGFAHEQNRPDVPGECGQPAQGPNGDLLLTPYDPDSVMNYCNAHYNNNGQLSTHDRVPQDVDIAYQPAHMCRMAQPSRGSTMIHAFGYPRWPTTRHARRPLRLLRWQ